MMNDPLVLLLGTWADDLTPAGILLRIGLAVGLSGIIGWERPESATPPNSGPLSSSPLVPQWS